MFIQDFDFNNLNKSRDTPGSEVSSFENANCSCSGFFKNTRIIKAFNDIKYNINENTVIVVHKLRVIDRTLSWFFKRSKPGGGRGL
jgi:hypothetical protein